MRQIFSFIITLLIFCGYFLAFHVPQQFAGINCHCLHPGATGRGAHKHSGDFFSAADGGNNGDNSGFVCEKDGYQAITLCRDFTEACFNDPNVKDSTYDWSKFPDDKIDGVRCAVPGPAETVECKCLNPGKRGGGNNGYTCTLNGIDHANRPFSYTNTPLPDRNDYCGNANYACWNDPTYTAKLGERDRTFFPWNYQHGIVCSDKKPPTTTDKEAMPLPPAPPCTSNLTKTGGMCLEILTAFGPIGTDPASFITSFFSVLLGSAGSIALIIFMRAGYQIMSARGNPEGIKEGREKLVAAILGLMFIIFSFVLLEVIGVDLLRLPNFSSSSGSSSGSSSAPACSAAGGACIQESSCNLGATSIGTSDCSGGNICCKADYCGIDESAGATCVSAASCPAGTQPVDDFCGVGICCK